MRPFLYAALFACIPLGAIVLISLPREWQDTIQAWIFASTTFLVVGSFALVGWSIGSQKEDETHD